MPTVAAVDGEHAAKNRGDEAMAKSGFPQEMYHGPHVARPGPDAELVDWSSPAHRVDRVRVRAHTCCCRRPAFELCAAAGLWFVRRVTDDGAIAESPWTPSRDAMELWEQILRGQAW